MPTDDAPPTTTQDQSATIGRAIRALRERAGITQEEAAEKLGITRQAWQNYESGGRAAVLRTDLQDRIGIALGVTREDIVRERDRQAGGSGRPGREPANDVGQPYQLEVLGRVRASPAGPLLYDITEPESVVDVSWMFGANSRTLRVAGDSMTGYVESGQLVIYDVSRWPRRGEGCVVELHNGEVYVKEYLETGQGVLRVQQRFPDEILSFPMAEVKGVYVIRFRGS